MSPKPPISKIAIGFYGLALAWLVISVGPALFLGRMGLAAGGLFSSLGLLLFVQPVLIALFGGVVQILSDIRWAILSKQEAGE